MPEKDDVEYDGRRSSWAGVQRTRIAALLVPTGFKGTIYSPFYFFMPLSFLPLRASVRDLAAANWKSGLTVAVISVPLAIALSIASGAGPVAGLITGIWATLIASLFGGSNYNIIGAAGALATVLFAATLAAPFGLGAAILPIITIITGIIILFVWWIGVDRLLYYIPSNVMYGFAAGVAFLIAASQLFDATGLSTLTRTGEFLGDIHLYIAHLPETDLSAITVFAVFLAAILLWKRFVGAVPAIIPISIIGIAFGFFVETFIPSLNLISLGDKFGTLEGTLSLPVVWGMIPALFTSYSSVVFLVKTAGVVALIAILETLITAKLGDKLTRTQSSTRRELLGLALANIGSGFMGGLPASGVFVRTGANIKAGATHRASATIVAIATAIIALIVLPYFAYIPMAVIAAILVNTALGLIETEKFKEFWQQDKSSFVIAILVATITIFNDAGTGVLVGSFLALLFFADRVSRGQFDIILNYADGSKEESRGAKVLHLPSDKNIIFATYSIAGFLGYIDSGQHAANLRHLAHAKNVRCVIIRLRDLFTIDFEGSEMLAEAVEDLERSGKYVCFSSTNSSIAEQLRKIPHFRELESQGKFFTKTSEALRILRPIV